MSLSLNQILFICSEIKQHLKGKTFTRCHNLGSWKYLLTFEEKRLLLCFQEPFLRFHLSRLQSTHEGTSLAKAINNFLAGTTLDNLEVVNNDRILKLTFKKDKKEYFLVAEFFQKKPNFYLLDVHREILSSLNKTDRLTYEPPAPRDQPLHVNETPSSSSAIEKLYIEKEQQAQFNKEKLIIKNRSTATLKRLQKKKKKCEQQLENCLTWSAIQHEAHLLQAHLFRLRKGMLNCIVEDWEQEGKIVTIILDPLKEPKTEVEKRFRTSKKMKAGIDHLQKQLHETEKEVSRILLQLEAIEAAQTLKQLKQWQCKALPKREKKTLPYREYTSESGVALWVGKSAKDNDKLTFVYAKGSDWWLHVNGLAGSHVVIRSARGQDPDPETLKDAIQLAIFYSKAKQDSSAEICLTQRKYVSRMGKRQPGKVQISKHKILHAQIDPARFQRLKKED